MGLPKRAFLLSLVPVLLLAGGADAEPEDAAEPSKLAFHGTATMKDVRSLGEQDFRFSLEIENPTDGALRIDAADLLLGHAGGWLVPLDPSPPDGSFFRGPLEVPATERIAVGSWSYRALTPATHALLAARVADGGARVAVPIVRETYAAPEPTAATGPIDIGVIGPLEVVPYADGRRSIVLAGQHQVLDGRSPSQISTQIIVGSDAGSSEPLRFEGLGGGEDRAYLWPFLRRLDVHSGFEKGWLLIDVEATIGDRAVKTSRSWPVVAVEPARVLSPVVGSWQLGNGPAETNPHSHSLRPDHRYSYDMVIVENGRTHRGDPHKNTSYFAWNGSIRAVADGVVVDVCDREPDNPGYRGSLSDCFNNRIVIRHDDGTHSAYVHIRQRSAGQRVVTDQRVKAGQVIAKVGNSGNSSEPHLHFQMFRIDDTGRIRAVPVAFTNAFEDAAATQALSGVPVGGTVVHFKQ